MHLDEESREGRPFTVMLTDHVEAVCHMIEEDSLVTDTSI